MRVVRRLALTLLAVSAAIGVAACGVRADGPPPIVVDRTACSHCGMLISEPLYAAAYQAPGEQPRVFDDIGCLLNAARAASRQDLRFWFHDAGSGDWVDGTAATFVGSSEIRTPMGGGFIAFRDAAAAQQAAFHYHASIVPSLATLLSRKETRQ